MYSSNLQVKMRSIREEEKNSGNLILRNPSVSICNSSNAQLARNVGKKDIKLLSHPAKNRLIEHGKSRSVFFPASTNTVDLQEWSKTPLHDMSKKPLISGVGENIGSGNKKNFSAKNKGKLGKQEKSNLILNVNFKTSLNSDLFSDSVAPENN